MSPPLAALTGERLRWRLRTRCSMDAKGVAPCVGLWSCPDRPRPGAINGSCPAMRRSLATTCPPLPTVEIRRKELSRLLLLPAALVKSMRSRRACGTLAGPERTMLERRLPTKSSRGSVPLRLFPEAERCASHAVRSRLPLLMGWRASRCGAVTGALMPPELALASMTGGGVTAAAAAAAAAELIDPRGGGLVGSVAGMCADALSSSGGRA